MPKPAPTLLDSLVHRLGNPYLSFALADRDRVKVDLQNANDYVQDLVCDRNDGEPVFRPAADVGLAMWPWARSLAFWRSRETKDAVGADYLAFVTANSAERKYAGLLFRAKPHARLTFVTSGAVTCHEDGRLAGQWTAAQMERHALVEHAEWAATLLGWDDPPRDVIDSAVESMCTAVRASRYLTSVLIYSAQLAHCRNVVQLERSSADSTPKPWLRAGHPRYSYRVLAIDPDALRVRRPDVPPSGNHGVSLHICRGHFATYTAERPLFGRYTGTYWIPQHARGDSAVGYAEKSYAIHRPAAAGTVASGSGR